MSYSSPEFWFALLRGLGSHTAAILGSVAHGTLEHSSVPVLVVR